MKPRVFVSSVIEGFESFRAAARSGIIAAGGEPVMVNEDFPAQPSSSRNACLDAVDSSDWFVLVLGARGGWVTPSGKVVVEEEYERALRRKLPILVMLQEIEREPIAGQLARRISDYVDGEFRRTFRTEGELHAEIERSLTPHFNSATNHRMTPPDQRHHFARPYEVQNLTMLRLVLTPEREEEVVDPVKLSSSQFQRRILELGHSEAAALLSYEVGKKIAMEGDDLVILQGEGFNRSGPVEHVRIALTERGELILDVNVSGRSARTEKFGGSGVEGMVVAAEDIEAVLRAALSFAGAVYDEADPFKRLQRFGYNVSLAGLGYRTIERNPQPRNAFNMRMGGSEVIKAFDEPRWLTRNDFVDPTAEIARVIVLLMRRAEN